MTGLSIMELRTLETSHGRSGAKRGRVLIIVQDLPVPYDRRIWLEATTLSRAGYVVSVILRRKVL